MIMDDSLRAVRRALIIFLAAVLVSVLAALTMIGFAALTRSLAWSVIGGLLVAALVSWILGSRILRRDRKAQRLVIGPLVVLGCSAIISLTRHPDPTGYTTARTVQDLEAVRARTGAPRVVLVGHSWGARFVVAYAQEHPDHVARR